MSGPALIRQHLNFGRKQDGLRVRGGGDSGDVVEKVVAEFKTLIHSMPRGNQYLLLYVLDLLSVFARKSDKNLMTAQSWCLSLPFEPHIANQACS